MSAQTVEELSELVAAELTRGQRVVLNAFRAIANETRIREFSHAVDQALDDVAAREEELRVAVDEERLAREALDAAVNEAEWAVGDRFVVEKNRTWFVTDEDETEMVEHDDGVARPVLTGRKARRSVTADEKKTLVASEARRQPAVRDAERAVRACEEQTGQARHAVGQAERRFRAAIHQLDAAAAQLSLLGAALPREDKR